MPTLASGGGAGTGWASFKFTTDGSLIAFETNANALSGATQAGAYLFDANENIIFGFTFTSVSFASDGTLLDVTTPPTGNIHMDTRAPGPSGGGLGVGLSLNDGGSSLVGTYKVLIWVAGNAGNWDFHVRSGAGNSLFGSETGSSTFLYGAEDFSGTAYAQNYQQGVGGRAALDTHKVIEVKNKLYGVFYDANFKIACAVVACVGAPTGTSALTAQGPGDAAPNACFCSYAAAPSGTYDFAMSGADASATSVAVFECPALGACVVALPWMDAVILGGVDAKLPA